MKLLLTSAGITNESIESVFRGLVGKPLSEVKVAYIPTAANVEIGDKLCMVHDLSKFADFGFSELDIVDISALSPAVALARLSHAEIMYFEGGNTFFLMEWLRKSGLSAALPGLLKNRVWIGVSAGSMVLGQSIGASRDDKVFGEDMGENSSIEGLGLVNFSLKPHYHSLLFPGVNDKNLDEVAKQLDHSLYAIDDNTAIMINGDKMEVISEGKWKEFK